MDTDGKRRSARAGMALCPGPGRIPARPSESFTEPADMSFHPEDAMPAYGRHARPGDAATGLAHVGQLTRAVPGKAAGAPGDDVVPAGGGGRRPSRWFTAGTAAAH